jgi:hypothetical protein
MVWMNQNQIAELFDTSKQNIGQHVYKILLEEELKEKPVVKNYFTTGSLLAKSLESQLNGIADIVGFYRDYLITQGPNKKLSWNLQMGNTLE